MQRVDDVAVLDHLLPAGTRELTHDELLAVETILDGASAWAAGELPWHVAATLGPIENPRTGRAGTGYGRFVALLTTSRSDPRWDCLYRLCDDLVRRQGLEVTDHGVFDRAELAGVTITGGAR